MKEKRSDKTLIDMGKRIKLLMDCSETITTQLELANAVGEGQTTIGRTIRGETEPGVLLVMKIARVFGVSIDFVVSGRKERK